MAADGTPDTALRRRLRVVHCSDIHLDGRRKDAARCFDGFQSLLAAARDLRPDLLLVAGDLFDSNRVPDETVEWARNALGGEACPIVMIPGNHDCVADDGIFSRFDFDQLPNVQMLVDPEGECRMLADLQVAVWGKGMVDHCPEFRPLHGVPPRPPGAHWYIGLGHGIHVPEGEHTGRSSPVHEGDIAASRCDYVALGHHHAALEVHAGGTAAAYCGSPTDTIGIGATFVVVEFEPGRGPVVEIRQLDG